MGNISFFGQRFFGQALLAVLLSTSLLACDLLEDAAVSACAYEDERSAELSAAEVDLVRVLAGAGSLEIIGRSDVDVVQVRGRACAPSSDLLRQTDVTLDREDGVARIEAVVPQRARLDLVIEVPEALAHEVEDGSGDALIRSVASLDVDDGSGTLTIEDVAGDVNIDDGSGSLDVARVGGTVRVVDGSGDLQVQDVRGNVRVVSDGSGDIRVMDVDGDFSVEEDGSGSIHYERVGGSVSLP